MLIKEVLRRDLSHGIEEIVQVDQDDQSSVYEEITDYVVTDRIRDYYYALLRAIAEGQADPDESIGVWISGFFGSGKSSFAKNLGYVLANRTVLGASAADLFKVQVGDQLIADLIDSINARIPTEVVMFDVQKDRSQSGQGNLSISPYMYRVLLREFGYAEDFDIAELEIGLEGEGQLAEFIQRFDARYAANSPQNVWTQRGRAGSLVWNRTGAILHDMDPATYPTPDSFARGLAQQRVEVTPRLLVSRAFELTERRHPGKALTFIIDEVGAYVAYSQDRLEDLRAVVELFGKESKNRVRSHRAIAPIWVIVTAQERLEEVTSAMGDDKRVLLAKVQDRFQHRIDLSPADIREVATRRVLAKTPKGEERLRSLYDSHQGQLHTAVRLERTSRPLDLTDASFAQFYPYLPHYIELSIDIVSGIRLQPGALRHIGGSNRTIISQVYQMLVNERTAYAEREVGALVTLDRIYELIEGQVGSTKQKDIADIAGRFAHDENDQGWSVRTAKTIALLEFVRDLPRTHANIAALLTDRIGAPAPHAEVLSAVERLVRAEFVRETEQGYKLQTAQEKNWSNERKDHMAPRPKDRNEIAREILAAIFAEPAFRTYSYRNLRTFRVGISVDDVPIGDPGQVPLALLTADDDEDIPRRVEDAKRLSWESTGKDRIYWVFPLDQDVDDLIANLYASRQMVVKYNGLRSQGKITAEESASLDSEKADQGRYQTRLNAKLTEALGHGQGIFRGAARDASDLGRQPVEIFRKIFDLHVPTLYPKLEMGARSLPKGADAEDVLKAANLNALPAVLHGGEGGLNLITKEGQRSVPNPAAPIAKEVLDFLRREHGYGNRVTGKMLIDHFTGLGYGWESDVLRLALAVLLRAGAIEVTHQGQRFRNHQDPQGRVPLTNATAFRSASFAPRESIDLRTLISAVRSYEALTGDEVDVEEGAIAEAFKALAAAEMATLLPTIAEVRANGLPGQATLEEYRDILFGVQAAASDDSVRILAGEGTSIREARERIKRITEAVNPQNARKIRAARRAIYELWPVLQDNPPDQSDSQAVAAYERLREDADTLVSLTEAETFYEHLPRIAALTDALHQAYSTLYLTRHEQRYTVYATAITEVRGRTEWTVIGEEMREALLQPLTMRQCASIEATEDQPVPHDLLANGAARCVRCAVPIGQIDSDIAAVGGVKNQVILRLCALAAPQRQVQRLRVADFFADTLDSAEAIDAALERLRAELYKLVAEDVTIVLE